ncbi:MAG: mevalonate kinase [Promethearchaeota archaeon]
MYQITASAPGKCILFGEHAVVYGYTAVVSSIDIKSTCIIKETKIPGIKWNFLDFDQTFQYSMEDLGKISSIPTEVTRNPFSQFFHALQRITTDFGFKPEYMDISVSSNLWKNSGLGSSASSACAFIKALETYFSLNLTIDQINSYCFLMEKFVHGTPSGIDNTIITHSGSIVYKKPNFSHLDGIPRIPLLIINSGVIHKTAEAVSKVKKLREAAPKKTEQLFQQIEKISLQGIVILKKGNIEQLAELFKENQKILEKLNLSTPEIHQIIEVGKEIGVKGVKITGAGLGGAVIAVAPEERLQDYRQNLEKKGFRSILTYIGGDTD